MPDLVGKTLKNRYRVDEFLGRGGMAEVYKVWDMRFTAPLAMKVLRADLAEDRVFMRRFQREAQTLAKLQHPNIVRFYGLEQEGRTAFILMDYIEGTTLRGEVFDAKGPLADKRVLEIMQPVCAALHYAHQMDFVHCDVKSANIMIHKNGMVYLGDFGIARMTDAATSTMVGFGTPAYMAPELVRGQEPSPQTDIYALGIVLYEMLTGGERPFTGEHAQTTGSTAEKVRWEQVNLKPPTPRKFNKKLSPQLEAVILRCLQKDPRRRYRGAQELLGALQAAISKAVPVPIGRKAAESKPVRKPSRRKPAILRKEVVPSSQPWWQRWYLWAGIAAVMVLVIAFSLNPFAKPVPLSVLVEPTSTAMPEDTPTPAQTNTPDITLTPLTPILEIGFTITPLTPIFEIGSTIVSEKDSMLMVYVPAGEFLMGSTQNNPDANGDEKPQHSVYLDTYWIDQTEVTNAMYAAFLNEMGNQPEGGVNWLDSADEDARISLVDGSWQAFQGYEDHPMVEVSWYGANAYCQWAGRRLPTEAEWEKAARGTDGRSYPWGEGISCDLANYWDCGTGSTKEVGSYPQGASPYGALDMAGNVWEWVADWYAGDYYSQSAFENPKGPGSGAYRVLRGGSWGPFERDARAADRFYLFNPASTSLRIGFRCALSKASP